MKKDITQREILIHKGDSVITTPSYIKVLREKALKKTISSVLNLLPSHHALAKYLLLWIRQAYLRTTVPIKVSYASGVVWSFL